LGNGTYQNRSYPVQVSGLSAVVAIAAGGAHSMAILPDGTARAWGYNYTGQLGTGATGNSNLPVAVTLSPHITQMTGALDTVALKDDGTVWEWGAGDSGTTFHQIAIPNVVRLTEGSGYDYVEAAITSVGELWMFYAYDTPVHIDQDGYGVSRVESGGCYCLIANNGYVLEIVHPQIGIYPTSVNFGTITTGSTSAAQTVSLTNISADPVTVTSISVAGANAGDFSVTAPALPVTLPTYANVTATVRFTPSAPGTRTASLMFADNGYAAPQAVALSGVGADPADIAVKQTVVLSGRRLTYTINVRNNGPGQAANVYLSGSVPADTQFVSISGSGCVPPGTFGLSCRFFNMANGAQQNVTLVVDIMATGPANISNTVSVSASTPDPTTKNNSSTLVTTWSGK
jgi:uncharacterized repeat protein (TIGR01451 family)